MNTTTFRFWEYVRFDLLRAAKLSWGPDVHPTGFRLWLGIFSPRFVPIFLCRTAHALYRRRLRVLAKLVSLVNFFLFGIEISLRCDIGKGLFLPHTQGTVIGAESIGENATIFQGVTLGAREVDISYKKNCRPILGSNVVIGAGAKVIGGLVIGDNSTVGANAVVLNNVPANVLVVGIPARIIKEYDFMCK